MKMGTAPFTVALLLLLVLIGGVKREGLMAAAMPDAEGNQPFLRGYLSLHNTTEALEIQGPSPRDVLPDLLCRAYQEISRNSDNFLADPSLYKEVNMLSTEVCQIMHSGLQTKVRGQGCNTCHAAADQICRSLEDHDQQIRIMQSAFDVCEALRAYVDKCKRFVFEYGPLVLSNLHKFLSSEDVCRLIRMCEEPIPPKKEIDHLYLRSLEHSLPMEHPLP